MFEDRDIYAEGLYPPVLTPAALFKGAEIGEKYQVGQRKWQGCPTLERTPSGRLWAGWYSGGVKEPDVLNYNLLVYSDDNGESWSRPVLIIDSVPELCLRAIDIQLWLDPDKRLWVFWTQTRDAAKLNENGEPVSYCDNVFGVWAVTTTDIDSDNPTWSEPRRLSDGFLRCKPTVTASGRWLLCGYDWLSNRFAFSSSDDKGKTWTRRHGCVKSGGNTFDETMIIQQKNGVLRMFARTNQGRLSQTFSFDDGETWTPVGFSMFESPSSRFYVRRLSSGRLLMINHYGFTGRTHLTAMLSDDDGEMWEKRLLLDERGISYPDAVECEDGRILCVYDRGRTSHKEILLASFTEEDIAAGELVSDGSYLQRVISKA